MLFFWELLTSSKKQYLRYWNTAFVFYLFLSFNIFCGVIMSFCPFSSLHIYQTEPSSSNAFFILYPRKMPRFMPGCRIPPQEKKPVCPFRNNRPIFKSHIQIPCVSIADDLHIDTLAVSDLLSDSLFLFCLGQCHAYYFSISDVVKAFYGSGFSCFFEQNINISYSAPPRDPNMLSLFVNKHFSDMFFCRAAPNKIIFKSVIACAFCSAPSETNIRSMSVAVI